MTDFQAPVLASQQPMPLAETAISASAAQAQAMVQAKYFMAYRKPRDVMGARATVLSTCKRLQFAEKSEYKLQIGGELRRGPNIRLAELLIAAWGNISVDEQMLFDDDQKVIKRMTVTDLETNASFFKDYTITKTVERHKKRPDVIRERKNHKGETIYIVPASEPEFYGKEAAMASRVLRNLALRLIPKDLIDEAVETCRKTAAAGDAQDPRAALKRVCDAFQTLGVKPEDLVLYLGHSVSACSPAELDDLRGIYSAIKEGEARWVDFLEEPDTPTPPKTEDLPGLKEQAPAAPRRRRGRTKGLTNKPKDPPAPPPEPKDVPPEGELAGLTSEAEDLDDADDIPWEGGTPPDEAPSSTTEKLQPVSRVDLIMDLKTMINAQTVTEDELNEQAKGMSFDSWKLLPLEQLDELIAWVKIKKGA